MPSWCRRRWVDLGRHCIRRANQVQDRCVQGRRWFWIPPCSHRRILRPWSTELQARNACPILSFDYLRYLTCHDRNCFYICTCHDRNCFYICSLHESLCSYFQELEPAAVPAALVSRGNHHHERARTMPEIIALKYIFYSVSMYYHDVLLFIYS